MKASKAGYLLLLLSVIINGARYHVDRWALQVTSPAEMIVISTTSAVAAMLACGVLWRGMGWRLGGVQTVTPWGILRALHGKWNWMLMATALGSLGGWLMATSVKRYGPELTAFLANLVLVMMVAGGVFAGERVTRGERVAIAVVLAGAFLFSYRGGELLLAAVGIMLLASACVAGKQLTVKGMTQGGDLLNAMAAALALMGLWAVVIGLASGSLHMPTPAGIVRAGIGGTMGSFVGMGLLYAGYHAVGVARGAPLDAMRPLVVLLVGLLLGHRLPGPVQLLGAGLILGGSAVLAAMAGAGRGHDAVRAPG